MKLLICSSTVCSAFSEFLPWLQLRNTKNSLAIQTDSEMITKHEARPGLCSLKVSAWAFCLTQSCPTCIIFLRNHKHNYLLIFESEILCTLSFASHSPIPIFYICLMSKSDPLCFALLCFASIFRTVNCPGEQLNSSPGFPPTSLASLGNQFISLLPVSLLTCKCRKDCIFNSVLG